MDRIFVDRESAYPNRYLMVAEDGTQTYVVLERADEPVTPGTPLNAETFNGMMEEIDTEKVSREEVSNENYLPNWYFANPVNTNGSSAYSAAAETIDGWRLSLNTSVNPSVTVSDGCVVLHNETASGTSCSCFIVHALRDPGRFSGKTVTFSVKFKSATSSGRGRIGIRSSGGDASSAYITSVTDDVVSLTVKLAAGITSLDVWIGTMMSKGGNGNFNFEIEAVKLEVGSVSTLANDKTPRKSEQVIESYSHAGYYYREVDGEKEWLNPPMVRGTEYRTAERANNEAVVYVKEIEFGKMPNKSAASINIGSNLNISTIDGRAWSGQYSIPIAIINSVNSIYYHKSNGTLTIETNADASSWTAVLILKYTK